jgi:hypothetical protein
MKRKNLIFVSNDAIELVNDVVKVELEYENRSYFCCCLEEKEEEEKSV